MDQQPMDRQIEEAWGQWNEMAVTAEPPPIPPPPPPGQSDPPGLEGGNRRRPGRAKRAVTAVIAAVVMLAGGYGIRAVTASGGTATPTSASSNTAVSAVNTQAGDVSSLVQRADKAVVKITSKVTEQGPFGQTLTGEAIGTGFIVTSDGLILTNDHVVESGQDLKVTLNNGQTYSATIVTADSEADLAVLRINTTGLSTLPLGDSSRTLAGESVVAIGYALGLQGSPTVTTGIVSSTGRTIQVQDAAAPSGPIVRTYRDVLQISAAINSGNSGGPLLNLDGQVVAINTAGAQGANNIGFAIPINQAKALLASAE
jgi:S1-C subfamily serine protease